MVSTSSIFIYFNPLLHPAAALDARLELARRLRSTYGNPVSTATTVVCAPQRVLCMLQYRMSWAVLLVWSLASITYPS